MNRSWRIFAIVALAALTTRFAHLAFIHRHPFFDLYTTWTDSDMHQFHAWARHLASGDWLDRDTFRPYFGWQEGIAPREVWNSWFGAHVYYQPPLYPYLMAAVLRLTGSVTFFRALQLALGAVNCGLIALIGTRVYDRATGLTAGLAAAAYAPFIFYDAELLRGTVVIATQLALLVALERRRAGWAGAAFGLSYVADPAILLFVPAALGWLWWSGRRAGGTVAGWWRAPAMFAVGALLCLLPLLARNLVVGAPALSCSTRAPLAFVLGNAPDASPAGFSMPPSTGEILRASGYTMTGTIAATLGAYHGSYGLLAAKQWEKLEALWGAYEVPDNPSFYYGARVSPVIRFSLRFLPVAALGLVGLAMALRRAPERPVEALLPLFLGSAVALFALAHVVSRYRQPMVVALLILAARAAVTVMRSRTRRAALAIPAAAAVIAFALPWRPPPGYGYDRPPEHVIVARIEAARGNLLAAETGLRDLIGDARKDPIMSDSVPELYYELGSLQAAAGHHRDAVVSFRAALAVAPYYGEAAAALENSRRALGPGPAAPPEAER